MGAHVTLLDLFFLFLGAFFPSALTCNSGPAERIRCAKTHKFSADDMSVIEKLEREEDVECLEGIDMCATGRFGYDPRLFDKQTGPIFKICALKLPKPIPYWQCQFFILGEKKTIFTMCTCSKHLCNKGEKQTNELISQEKGYAEDLKKVWGTPKDPWKNWKPWEPGKTTEHETTDTEKPDKENKVPDIVEDEEYIYGNLSKSKESTEFTGMILFAILATKIR